MEFFKPISDFIPFSITIIIAVTFMAIIIYFVFKSNIVGSYAKVIGIAVLPGIVLHEASHLFFSKVAGIEVTDVSFFHLEDQGVGGYVEYVPHDSFIAALFVGLGPIILNGFVISFILFYLKSLHEAILYYLVFALTIGSCPSSADLKNIFDPFHRNGKKALIELLILILPIIPALFIGNINTNFFLTFDWVLAVISYFVILLILILIHYTIHEKGIQ